jgi:hypothetical protein
VKRTVVKVEPKFVFDTGGIAAHRWLSRVPVDLLPIAMAAIRFVNTDIRHYAMQPRPKAVFAVKVRKRAVRTNKGLLDGVFCCSVTPQPLACVALQI